LARILNDSCLLASHKPTNMALTSDAAPLNVFCVLVTFCVTESHWLSLVPKLVTRYGMFKESVNSTFDGSAEPVDWCPPATASIRQRPSSTSTALTCFCSPDLQMLSAAARVKCLRVHNFLPRITATLSDGSSKRLRWFSSTVVCGLLPDVRHSVSGCPLKLSLQTRAVERRNHDLGWMSIARTFHAVSHSLSRHGVQASSDTLLLQSVIFTSTFQSPLAA